MAVSARRAGGSRGKGARRSGRISQCLLGVRAPPRTAWGMYSGTGAHPLFYPITKARRDIAEM